MKNFKIGDKLTRFPLIQGGMGVGISLGRLAGTVAKEGGIGIISHNQKYEYQLASALLCLILVHDVLVIRTPFRLA